MSDNPGDWKLEGAPCASGKHDPEMWFSMTPDLLSAAKSLCEGCPVRERCLNYAIDQRLSHGVWGGLTGDERYNYRQRLVMRRRRSLSGSA